MPPWYKLLAKGLSGTAGVPAGHSYEGVKAEDERDTRMGLKNGEPKMRESSLRRWLWRSFPGRFCFYLSTDACQRGFIPSRRLRREFRQHLACCLELLIQTLFHHHQCGEAELCLAIQAVSAKVNTPDSYS